LHYCAVARHHRLSVKPHVVVIFYLEGGLNQKNGIYIANPGLGPAIIKAISVEVGGKLYSAASTHPWRNVLHDLTISVGCFKYGLVQPRSALKSGEEWALLTLTQAKLPIVDGRPCQDEMLKFLKAEGLKVHVQYESMYGEPDERIAESPFDNDMMSDIATAEMQLVTPQLAEQLQSLQAQTEQLVQQQLAPQLVEQLQSIQAQTEQLVHRMQQVHDNTMKRTAALAERMLFHELYGNWWLWRKDRPMNPQD
jgi:hypothetical protein